MYRWEKTMAEDRFRKEKQNPSFSSRLLDEIYRSIDGGEKKCGEIKLCRETMPKKQISSLGEASSVEKWMNTKQRRPLTKLERNSNPEYNYDYDHDHDAIFSSTSNSSDSSSSGFSSSDTESMYGSSTKASCFAPRRSKPVRTGAPARSVRTAGSTLFYEQREIHVSESRLKKVKQPISPGGRVVSFLNSLFNAGNGKKTKNMPSKPVQESTCSSASSFSRSCLIKHSPSTRKRLQNGVQRTVRFYPVSVIVDEECRPCGHKCLHEEEDSTPTKWKLERSPLKKREEKREFLEMEKSRRVEDAAREFLREYHRNQKKRGAEQEDDDDGLSCSSSDLFELDHLEIERYQEELPVYETTRVCRNRKSLIM